MENYFNQYRQWECNKSKLHQYWSIYYELYRRNIDIGTVNTGKKFWCYLVIWEFFYEDLCGRQAHFESPGIAYHPNKSS